MTRRGMLKALAAVGAAVMAGPKAVLAQMRRRPGVPGLQAGEFIDGAFTWFYQTEKLETAVDHCALHHLLEHGLLKPTQQARCVALNLPTSAPPGVSRHVSIFDLGDVWAVVRMNSPETCYDNESGEAYMVESEHGTIRLQNGDKAVPLRLDVGYISEARTDGSARMDAARKTC